MAKNLILLFCLLSTFSYSQTWQWTKRGGGTGGKSVCTDNAGNCYVVADSAGYSKFLKYNSSGALVWSNHTTLSANAIVSDHSGFLYIVGDSLAKYDTLGNLIWKGGTGVSNSISLDNAGYIYVTGTNSLLKKYDPSGNQLWNRNVMATGNSIATDSAGNSYLTGYFSGSALFGSYTLTALGTKDIFIAKYDSAGTCLWAKRAGGKFNCCYSNDCGNGITIDPMGNAYVTGLFVDTADFDSFILNGNSNDIFLAKYSPGGNAIWVKQATGASDQEGRCIALDNSGNILVGGSYVPTVNFGGVSLTGWGNYDAFVAKYDYNGTFISAIKAGGAVWNEYANGICVDNLGNTFVTGSFSNTAYFGTDTLNSSFGGYDIYTSKIDLMTGIYENQTNSSNINVYPNPATNQITLEFNLTETKNTSIEIKNVLGQTVKKTDSGFSTGKNQIEIDLTEFPKGLYFIQLQNGNNLSGKKVVKQ